MESGATADRLPTLRTWYQVSLSKISVLLYYKVFLFEQNCEEQKGFANRIVLLQKAAIFDHYLRVRAVETSFCNNGSLVTY